VYKTLLVTRLTERQESYQISITQWWLLFHLIRIEILKNPFKVVDIKQLGY